MHRARTLRFTAVAIAAVLVLSMAVPAIASASTLYVSGSTTLQPLCTQWAAAYHRLHPATSLIVAGGGSGTGFKDVAAGRSNIGMSSRPKLPTDPVSVVLTPVARDAVAIIVAPTNPLRSCSPSVIKSIYLGRITNWHQVNSTFPNRTIILVGRTGASGTYEFFKEKFLGGASQSIRTKMYSSNGMVRAAVARDPYAIGYVSMAFINTTVRGVKMNSVYPSKYNVLTGRYPYWRYLYLLTKGAPRGEALSFINYARSSAGQYIASREYISLR